MKRSAGAAIVLFLLVMAIVPAVPTGAATVEGQVDLSFGSCGVSMVLPVDLETGEGNNGSAYAVAAQPDGKIVMAGRAEGPDGLLVVTRLMPDGSLDYGFGSKGNVFTSSSGATLTATAVALQGDGRIVVEALRAPYDGFSSSSFWFARYMPSGALDPSFGSGGTVNLSQNDAPHAMVLQPDGKIVAGGDLTVVRLLPSGAMDPAFGSAGVTSVPGAVTALATQPDGKIVTGGIIRGTRNDDLAVHRLLPNGALDPSFGTGGGSTLDTAGHDGVVGVAVDGSGRIVVAGNAAINGVSGMALVRYLPDGQPDSSFGSGGLTLTNLAQQTDAAALVLQPDGKAVVAATLDRTTDTASVGLARFTTDGQLDATFGDGGKSVASGGYLDAQALAAAPGGSGWIVAGLSGQYSGPMAVRFLGPSSPAASVTPQTCTKAGSLQPGTMANFGSWARNTVSPPRTFTFTSTGTAPVRVGPVELSTDSGRELRIVADGCSGRTVPAGGSCTVSVSFTPTRFGYEGGTLIVWHNGRTAVAVNVLQGLGTSTVWVSGSGWNGLGQVGVGPAQGSTVPQQNGLSGVVSVAAGYYHSLAVKADGTVWAWGWNGFGQVGDGTTVDRHAPVQVPGLTNVASVAAGAYQSFAVTRDGSVYAWGYDNVGQLGDGTTTDRHVPGRLTGLPAMWQVSSGAFHTVGVASDGTVWAWGWNIFGQLGDGTTIDRHAPVLIPLPAHVQKVAAGAFHSLASTVLGAVWSWGLNNVGQLGDGTTTDHHAPAPVPGLSGGFNDIAAGGYHSLASYDGHPAAWGWNALGQLGDGTTIDRHTPVWSAMPGQATSIAAGVFHSLAASPDGGIRGWGWNDWGQLGNGQTATVQPWPVSSLFVGGTVVSGGVFHTLGG